MIVLKAEHLIVQNSKKTLFELDQQSFRAGEFWGIIGANGAGKSSFLKSVAGDYRYSGNILMHGQELQVWPSHLRAQHIGVLPQHSQLSFAFTAKEVVELGLTPLSLHHDQARQLVREMMDLCDCLHLRDDEYPLLSGGEKQRVNLARVLVQISQARETPILLLDEALSAQDLGHQHHLLQLLKSLCRDKRALILGVLHDLNHALQYCDKAMLIHQGVVFETGAPDKVLRPETLKQCWGYEAEFLTNERGTKLIA